MYTKQCVLKKCAILYSWNVDFQGILDALLNFFNE